MPFVRTAVPRDTSPERKAAIVQGIHQALIDAIAMPPEELFNLVTTYGPDEFFFSRHFNGIAHSDALIVVEITLRRGRGRWPPCLSRHKPRGAVAPYVKCDDQTHPAPYTGPPRFFPGSGVQAAGIAAI